MPEETSPEFDLLAQIAKYLRKDFVGSNDPWVESPLAWIRVLPPALRGKLGVSLIRGWLGAKDFSVDVSGDSEADLLINRHRVEVKFSTLWKSGVYKFQQIRDQNYEYAICLGVSPFEAHCWVISKPILNEHVIGHKPQHRGAKGTDTFWFSVEPNNPPGWLLECGGTLEEALVVLRKLSRK